ncbi:hypothetical protein ACEPAH_6306 [Sanghuangporus vaninii]
MTCYFDFLAPELISLIFIYCISKRDGHFIEYHPYQPPLVFLHVCRRWRYIAFQTRGIFDSISFRRRPRAPLGYDFGRDSWVLHDFIHFPRAWYRISGRPSPLSMQLCYGDIKQYGDRTMWCDLIRMVRIIVETTENLERFYLRVPDDCMEKLLMKICSEARSPIRHPTLRSLTLHSTRESLLQRRYISWWYDQEASYMPGYYHKLNLSQLPGLEELGLHFPGPITLDPVSRTVRKLHVSLFKWEQMEEYLTSCPNVEHLILELREPLLEQIWEPVFLRPEDKFPLVHTFEVRSALKGWACANKLCKLFMGVKMPNLKVLRLRRLPQSDKTSYPTFLYSSLIMSEVHKLEELELIDFPPESCCNWNVGAAFCRAHNLKRFAYREEEIVSSSQYFEHLLSELTFYGTELRAPRLEILELDSMALRNCESPTMHRLVQLIASRRNPTFFANTSEKKRPKVPIGLPTLIRKVFLPLGCSDIIREIDAIEMCREVEFDYLPTLERLELENDLDVEGPERGRTCVWSPLGWPSGHEVEGPIQSQAFGPFDSGTSSLSTSPSSSMLSVQQTPRNINGGLEMSRNSSQRSLGLDRLDSLAEVELML